MAAHLPGLLLAAGTSTVAAITAAASEAVAGSAGRYLLAEVVVAVAVDVVDDAVVA